MYILFIADFDENGASVARLNSLEEVVEYLGWEDQPELVSELVSEGVIEDEWHSYHLEVV